MSRARLAVLVSGSGSNLQAILDACRDDRLQAEVVLVVSNRPDAYGLVRAEQAGVPRLVQSMKTFTGQGLTREDFDRSLAEAMAPYAPDLVVLAGWMHILSPAFLDCFPARVLNLHPALPGAFPGTNAIERAYQAYQLGQIPHTGCMVHYAVPEVDAGPVVGQAIVPIFPEDSLQDLEARMHEAEHQTLVEALAWLG